MKASLLAVQARNGNDQLPFDVVIDQEIVEGIFDSIRQGGVGHGSLQPTPAMR